MSLIKDNLRILTAVFILITIGTGWQINYDQLLLKLVRHTDLWS